MEILRVQRTAPEQFAVAKALNVCVAFERSDPVSDESVTYAVWLTWLAVMSWEVAETSVFPLPLRFQFNTGAVPPERASVALSACQVSPKRPSSSKSGTRNSNWRPAGL